MRPTRIEAKGFRSYETLTLDLPTGATAVIGSNGAGKSTVLAMIREGLFASGKQPYSDLAKSLRNGSERVETAVYVDHAGEHYRVRRGAGKATYLDLDLLQPDGTWEPLKPGAHPSTQALIDATFALDYDTFTASAFLGQGAGSFAQLTAGEQYKLFSSLMGLDQYDRLAKLAHDQLTTAQADLDRLQAGLDQAREQLEGLPAADLAAAHADGHLRENEAALAAAVQARDHADAALAAAREQTQAVETARQALALAEEKHRRLAQVKENADGARFALVGADERLSALQARADALPAAEAEEERLRAEVEGHRRRVAEYDEACREQMCQTREQDAFTEQATNKRASATEARAKADRCRSHSAGECDRCGQTLGAEAAERAAANFDADAERWETQAAEDDLRAAAVVVTVPVMFVDPGAAPTRDLAGAQAATADCRAAGSELAALTERLTGLRATIAAAEQPEYVASLDVATAALKAATEAVTRAQLELVERRGDTTIQELQQAKLAADIRARDAQTTVDHARTAKAHADATLLQLQAVQKRVTDAEPRERELQARIDVLAAAEKAHGRNGIPALILENRVGEIEQQATAILSELGGDTAGARVEIRTQRETQKGEIRDELQIVLVTADGHDRAFDAWSGGEQMRINIALRWALAAGTGVEIVILDEPAALDDQGKTALRDIIEFLLGRGVKTVLVVSHEGGLRDSFEQVLEVVKVDGRSRVVGAPVRELETVA